MTTKELEARFATYDRCMEAMSLYIMNEVLPLMEKMKAEGERAWLTEQDYRETKHTLANVAKALHDHLKNTRHVRAD